MANIKGTGMVQPVRDVRKSPEARRLVPARLAKYLAPDMRISVSEWYPEEDYIAFLRILVRAAGDPAGIWEKLGAMAARQDIAGVYKGLLRHGNPGATVLKGGTLWSSYHDTGRFVVRLEGRGAAHHELFDYGYPNPETCGITTGYTLAFIELAGGTEARVVHTSCVHQGDDTCVWQSQWKDPD
jgi:hypothetical protein